MVPSPVVAGSGVTSDEGEDDDDDEEEVFYPGSSGREMEEGHAGKGRRMRIPPDQGWLRSDPGTPNLAETWVVPTVTPECTAEASQG
jgi:hypothetical protein